METTNASKPEVKTMTAVQIVEAFAILHARVEALELAAKPTNTAGKEMTDDDARRILFGDLKDMKHNEVAKKTGLSYGQIYSCRLQYTFKAIHKEMREQGIANGWVKA